MTKPQDVTQVEDYKEDDPILKTLYDKAVEEYPEITQQLVVGNKVCYLKKVNRGTLEIALGFLMKINSNPEPIKAGEIIINTCWVCGDEEIRSNDDYFMGACLQASGLIEQKSSFLKKRN